jgi:putative intracellular protease/amidase
VNIGIFIFEGTEELDFAGPYEVLTQWAQQAADKREIFVFTIARSTDPVRCAHGLRVLPDYAWDDAPSLDLLLFPGGRVRQFLEDEQTLDWVRSIRATGALMTSVCTGAHVYASDIQYETPVAV